MLSSVRHRCLLVVVFTAVACAGLDLLNGPALTMKGFRTQGREENGSTWQLVGARATIKNAVYMLEDITLVVHDEDGRTTTVKSPSCTYKQADELIESNAPVDVRSQDLHLQGVGYDILLKEKKIRIRDKVRMQVSGASHDVLREHGLSAPEAE